MMMKSLTRDEFLRRLEAVEAYVDSERPTLQARIASLETVLARQKADAEAVAHSTKVDGVVSELRDILERVIEPMVERRLGSRHTIGESSGDYSLEKVSTTVRLEETSRERRYSDDTIQGKVLRIIHEGAPTKKWKPGEIFDGLTRRWGEVTSRKVLGNELIDLVTKGSPPPLARLDQGNSTWAYFVPEGIVLIKEPKS